MEKFKMVWPSLLVPVMILAVCGAASAQAPDYNLGKTPTEDEIRAWDISIPPDGKGLPPGSGTAVEGAKLYVQKGCVVCHGVNGRGGLPLIWWEAKTRRAIRRRLCRLSRHSRRRYGTFFVARCRYSEPGR